MDSTKEECCADLRIRPMSVADLPGVLEVERECFSVPWSERIFLDVLDLDYYHFVTAFCGDQVAGYSADGTRLPERGGALLAGSARIQHTCHRAVPETGLSAGRASEGIL